MVFLFDPCSPFVYTKALWSEAIMRRSAASYAEGGDNMPICPFCGAKSEAARSSAAAHDAVLLGLSPRMLDALIYIVNAIDYNGISPSYAEIAAALSISSRSHVHGLVQRLIKRGFLVNIPGSSRSIAPTSVGKKYAIEAQER